MTKKKNVQTYLKCIVKQRRYPDRCITYLRDLNLDMQQIRHPILHIQLIINSPS
uniref:Uncharacterized protein n=1 Tax=Anguilla anguilla TaxID=7936 RepID=A0A0E9XIL9_ANGAN